MSFVKLSTFFRIVVSVVIIDLINGEVDFCLDLDSKHISESKGSLNEVPALLQQASKEIKEVINKTGLGTGTGTSSYTNFYLNFSHPAITLEGNFTDGTTSIDDQTIRLWTPTENGFEIFNLTFPVIFVNGSYDAKGYVGANHLFNIYGNGTFSLTMTNFSVAAVTGLAINSSELCIPLSVNVYLKGFKSNFKDFMGGDEELEPLLNGAIQSIVPEAIRIILRENMDQQDPLLQQIIDDLIHGVKKSESLTKLLYILANNKDQLNSILKKVIN